MEGEEATADYLAWPGSACYQLRFSPIPLWYPNQSPCIINQTNWLVAEGRGRTELKYMTSRTWYSRSRVWYSAPVTWRTAWISAIGVCSATGDNGDSTASLEAEEAAAAAAAGTVAEARWSSPMTLSTHRRNSGSLLCAYFVSKTFRTSWAREILVDFVPIPSVHKIFLITFAASMEFPR